MPISTSQLQHACIFSLLCLSLALSHLSPNHSYSLKTSSFPPFFHYKLVPTTLFCACALPQIGSLVIVKMKFRHLLMSFFARIPYVSSFGIQNYPNLFFETKHVLNNSWFLSQGSAWSREMCQYWANELMQFGPWCKYFFQI